MSYWPKWSYILITISVCVVTLQMTCQFVPSCQVQSALSHMFRQRGPPGDVCLADKSDGASSREVTGKDPGAGVKAAVINGAH